MKLYNFYVEDSMIKKAQDKLTRLVGEKTKGQVAALLRVLLNQFIMTPDEKVNPLLIEAIDAEAIFTTTKNKRSRL